MTTILRVDGNLARPGGYTPSRRVSS